MDIPEAIKRLDDLPTADAIADELVSMGVKGTRSSPTRCAVAVYLMEITGERRHVGLGLGQADAVSTRDSLSAMKDYHIAPKVAQFIRGFDNGQYPKLDG